MKSAHVSKSASAARSAALRPAAKTPLLTIAEYELVTATLREFVKQRTPAEDTENKRPTAVDMMATGAVKVANGVIEKLTAPVDEQEILVRFTAAQMQRLKDAAAVVGDDVTVRELIVAGSMQSLDWEDSPLDEAIEAVTAAVDFYARGGASVPEGDYRDDHPLGTATTNCDQALQTEAWFREREAEASA